MRPKLFTCPKCDGSGKNSYNSMCAECGGTGSFTEVEAINRGLIESPIERSRRELT